MNTPPQTFKNLNKKAGVPEEKIQEKWLGIWEKTISQFLGWLIKENELNNDQIIRLKELIEESLKNRGQKKSIMELIKPVIRKNQQKTILNKYAGLFVFNLDRYYQSLNLKEKSND